ncbi:MAG: hypothetical protein GXP32_08770 [Kiritimatiellaeota bacterium]|nr:hypothetical protein [Kiritimatiellota bacterium]
MKRNIFSMADNALPRVSSGTVIVWRIWVVSFSHPASIVESKIRGEREIMYGGFE